MKAWRERESKVGECSKLWSYFTVCVCMFVCRLHVPLVGYVVEIVSLTSRTQLNEPSVR